MTTDTLTTSLESAPSDIEQIAALTRAGGQPQRLEPGQVYVVHSGDGSSTLHDLRDPDKWPSRIEQTVQLSHVDSLLAYWDKHSDAASDVYADRDKRTITAILDAHDAATDRATDGDVRARWQSHRAVLTLTLSDAMRAWLAADGKLHDQVAFAEFIEENMAYIADPDAADLLEMVQHFQATTSATFKSGHKLVSGQRQFEYNEQIDATVRGDAIAVPASMTVRLPVWRSATTAEEFTARIRYRINHGGAGKLGIGYKLLRPVEVLDAAFEAEVAKVEQHVGLPVLRGTAAGS